MESAGGTAGVSRMCEQHADPNGPHTGFMAALLKLLLATSPLLSYYLPFYQSHFLIYKLHLYKALLKQIVRIWVNKYRSNVLYTVHDIYSYLKRKKQVVVFF